MSFGIRFSRAFIAITITIGLAVGQSLLAGGRADAATSDSQSCKQVPVPVLTALGQKVRLKIAAECSSAGDTRVQVSSTSQWAVLLVRTAKGTFGPDQPGSLPGFPTMTNALFPTVTNAVADTVQEAEFGHPNTMENPAASKSRVPPGWVFTLDFPPSDHRPLGHRVSIALDIVATVKYEAAVQISLLIAKYITKESFPELFKADQVLACANSLAQRFHSLSELENGLRNPLTLLEPGFTCTKAVYGIISEEGLKLTEAAKEKVSSLIRGAVKPVYEKIGDSPSSEPFDPLTSGE